jgi:hypothetical protein
MLGLLGSGGCAALLSSCSLLFPKHYGPFPMAYALKVATPEWARAGISLLEIDVTLRGDAADSSWVYSTEPSLGVSGQAAVVDLGARGKLFALLRSTASGGWVNRQAVEGRDADMIDRERMKAYADDLTNGGGFLRTITDMTGPPAPPRALAPGEPPPVSGYPLLVRFEDSRDPRSVEEVDPYHLDRSFGAGVSLQTIDVAVGAPNVAFTRAHHGNPIPIVRELPWLRSLGDRNLDGSSDWTGDPITGSPLAHVLRRSDFLRERTST